MSKDSDDGAVTLQLGKVLLNLFLPGLVRPLHCRLRESLLLRPVPISTWRPRGRDVRPSRCTIAAREPQEGDTAIRTHAAVASMTFAPT